jgi:5-hydroxyisourate hydrolase-like protein (transthyretin family)
MKQLLKMKRIRRINRLLFISLLAASNLCLAQSDSTKPETSVTIHHFIINNSFQYLLVEAKTKINSRWQPLKRQVFQLYLDSNKAENLINKVMTDSDGKAKAIVPPGLKATWDASPTHKFIAVAEATSKEEETTTEAEITKAKILIDTSNNDGARTVNVQVLKLENNNWTAVKDVDVKIGVKRLGGELKIGDEETYSTDSLGQVAGEFKRDSLPGDVKGNLTLVARVEDNDQLGSLSIEKTVPWGIYVKPVSNFGQRALWAARGKAPIWLMFMAYSIILAVWGVIFYLILRIIKISRLGKAEEKSKVLQDVSVG